MKDFQLKSHTIKGKDITMRVYKGGFTLFINHPYGYDTSVMVDGGLYKEIINEFNREVVAELRKLGKNICDGCLAEFKIRYSKNPMKGCDRCPLTKFRNQIDELFGCETSTNEVNKPMVCEKPMKEEVKE